MINIICSVKVCCPVVLLNDKFIFNNVSISPAMRHFYRRYLRYSKGDKTGVHVQVLLINWSIVASS